MHEEPPTTMNEHLTILGAVILIAFFITLIAWSLGFFTRPKREEEEGVAALSFKDVLGAFGVFLFMSAIFAPVIAVFGLMVIYGMSAITEDKIQHDPIVQGWVNLIVILGVVAGLALFFKFLNPRIKRHVWGANAFISLEQSVKDYLLGACTWLLSFPFVVIVTQVLAMLMLHFFPGPQKEQVAVRFIKSAASTGSLFWLTVISVMLVVPVLEEILFRGFLQSWLKQKFGWFKAILIASLVFALFHFSTSQGTFNVELIGSLFVLSCFLGYLYERQNSLWASIGLHSCFNAISILGIILTNSE